jgi:hypothetical protein
MLAPPRRHRVETQDSRYISGRSPYWLKSKNPASEAVRRGAFERLGDYCLRFPEEADSRRAYRSLLRHSIDREGPEFGQLVTDLAGLLIFC